MKFMNNALLYGSSLRYIVKFM